MEGAGEWLDVHDLGQYSFDHHSYDDTAEEKRVQRCIDADDNAPETLSKLYAEHGMLRSVCGVLVTHRHGFPHVLLLRRPDGTWKLPGGRLDAGSGEVGGLKNMLGLQLGRRIRNWEIGSLLSTWWRPNYDFHMYPYKPAHASHPKERRRTFVVQLPSEGGFSVASCFKLVAVPLCDLYGKHRQYGPIIASLPHMLSRFSLNAVKPTVQEEDAEGDAAMQPASGDGDGDGTQQAEAGGDGGGSADADANAGAGAGAGSGARSDAVGTAGAGTGADAGAGATTVAAAAAAAAAAEPTSTAARDDSGGGGGGAAS